MRATTLLLALSVYSTSFATGANELTNDELQKSCAETTIVMGRDEAKELVRAGEKLDGFCSGYLQATFSAFASNAKCKAEDTSPDFLLSVYEQYVKDKKIAASANASNTLMQAFRRVPNCK